MANKVQAAFDSAIAGAKNLGKRVSLNVEKAHLNHKVKKEDFKDKILMLSPEISAVHQLKQKADNFQKNGGYSQFRKPEGLLDSISQLSKAVESPSKRRLAEIDKELGELRGTTSNQASAEVGLA